MSVELISVLIAVLAVGVALNGQSVLQQSFCKFVCFHEVLYFSAPFHSQSLSVLVCVIRPPASPFRRQSQRKARRDPKRGRHRQRPETFLPVLERQGKQQQQRNSDGNQNRYGVRVDPRRTPSRARDEFTIDRAHPRTEDDAGLQRPRNRPQSLLPNPEIPRTRNVRATISTVAFTKSVLTLTVSWLSASRNTSGSAGVSQPAQ